jgi:hypothetical protein
VTVGIWTWYKIFKSWLPIVFAGRVVPAHLELVPYHLDPHDIWHQGLHDQPLKTGVLKFQLGGGIQSVEFIRVEFIRFYQSHLEFCTFI